jgi:flagellar hook-basal body complex protein FliE
MIDGIGARALNLRMPQELPGMPGAGAAGAGAAGAPAAPANGPGSFAGSMEKFLGEVNDQQLKSASALESFARGDTADMHRVILAQQEASISLRLVTEMRDKLLQSYQEIMRMPV